LRGKEVIVNSSLNSNQDSMQVEKLRNELKIKNRYSWLVVIVSILLLLIFSYTIFKEEVELDGITLLSFILAFFSIYLSATFYFKATEQSNQFYDRSYSHTKDIAESLSSMRGEFGKSLTHLEQYNESLHRRMDAIPLGVIKQKSENLTETKQERDALLEELLNKAGLQAGEKKEYEDKLNQYEMKIRDLMKELNYLRQGNYVDRGVQFADSRIEEDIIQTLIYSFSQNKSYKKRLNNGEDINFIFKDFLKLLDIEEINLLLKYGIIDEEENLLDMGISLIKRTY
jgi:hypothetical protein